MLLAFLAGNGMAQTCQCETDTVRLGLNFKQNSTSIDSLYAGNGESLARMRNIIGDSCRDISTIRIWGSTSPEGPKRVNEAKAMQRAEAMRDLALSYGAPDSLIHFDANLLEWPDATPVDYPSLRAAYIMMATCSKAAARQSTPAQPATPFDTESAALEEEAETDTIAVAEEYPAPTTSERGRYFSLSARANLLRWATLTPDVGLELRFRRHYALVVHGSWTTWSWNGKERRYALREIAPELRYYIGKECRGYVGVMYKVGAFNYKFSEFGKQGNILGGGLTGGYVLPLNRCLDLDFTLGLGYLHAHYDRYNVISSVRVRQGKGEKNWWGPIAAGVTLTWKLF